MGVPGFFSWLIKRYPLCLQNLNNYTKLNIDNLYLDMNVILYKCSMDDSTVFKDLLLKKNFTELWLMIFNYINKIITLVSPKKLSYRGLDGPAPRAKMN